MVKLLRISLPEQSAENKEPPEKSDLKSGKPVRSRRSYTEFTADFIIRTVILGLILRVTVKDYYYPLSVFFYALPLGVLDVFQNMVRQKNASGFSHAGLYFLGRVQFLVVPGDVL